MILDAHFIVQLGLLIMQKIDNERLGYLVGRVGNRLSSILYSSVITIFYLNNNLTNVQIGMIWSILLFSQMLTDFPTGSLADKIGRLKVYMLGMIFMGVSYIAFVKFVNNIYMLYVSAALAGLAESLISGTLLPWFITSYKRKHEDYKRTVTIKLLADNRIITSLLSIVLGFIMYYLKLNARLILIIAGIISIIFGIFLFVAFEDNGAETKETILNINKASFRLFVKEKRLWIYTLILTCGYINFSVYQFVWQPVAKTFLSEDGYLVLIKSYNMIIIILAGLLIKKLAKDIKLGYAGFILIVPVSLYFLYISDSLGKVVLYLTLFTFFRALVDPILSAYIHDYIPDSLRSTTVSLVSSISSILLVILQPIIGWLLDFNSNKYILMLLILNGVVNYICLFFVLKDYNNN